MALKAVSAAAIGGIVTGVVLETGGFGPIQDAMAHFWPGIMTVGCAAMADNAREEVLRQSPATAAYYEQHPLGRGDDEITVEQCDEWLAGFIAAVGESVNLEGPINVSRTEIATAFEKLTA